MIQLEEGRFETDICQAIFDKLVCVHLVEASRKGMEGKGIVPSMRKANAKAVGFFLHLFLFLNKHRFSVCCILCIFLDTNETMACRSGTFL